MIRLWKKLNDEIEKFRIFSIAGYRINKRFVQKAFFVFRVRLFIGVKWDFGTPEFIDVL